MNKVEMKRRSRGMTQQELAERAGVSRATVIAIERGQSNPTFHTIEHIAKALDCPPDEIWGKTNAPNPEKGKGAGMKILVDGKVIFPESAH